MKFYQPLAAVALAVAAVTAGPAAAQSGDIKTYQVEAPFDQVRQDLSDAIINRGYVIDYNAKIGDMLARTAQDVGAEKKVYQNAETLQFCSAVLSRKAMEADPMNIAFCPYSLFVYEPAGSSGTVTVGYRETSGEGPMKEVNDLLDEIAREASDQ